MRFALSYLQLPILSVACLLLVECASKPQKKEPIPATPAAHAEFQKAKKLAAKNKPAGIAAYKKFIQRHPGSDLVDQAYLGIGHIYFEGNKYNEAYQAYIAIFRGDIISKNEARAGMMAAKCLTELGRIEEASSLAGEARKAMGLGSDIDLELSKLQFSLYSRLNDKIDALRALVQVSEKETTEANRKAYRLKAVDYVEQLSARELEDVARNSDFQVVRAQALFKVGFAYFEARDFDKANSYLQDAITLVPTSESAERAREMLKQINARSEVDFRTIGVVLPLSGPQANVGQRTLKGLQLGLGIYGQDRSEFRLAVQDSEGNPDIAKRAVEKLVVDDHVMAIVGDLTGRSAQAVASKCEELGVPNVTLSQKSGLTDLGPFVFRSALTGEMQIQKLVQAAMEDFGYKRFAILHPNDSYGTEYANIFWDEVLSRGGEIVGVQSYQSGETDFNEPVKRLVGTYFVEDRLPEYKLRVRDWAKKQKSVSARNRPPADLLPPVVQFDALFIPDDVKALGQIAPTLAYNDISKMPLLGTNLWNSRGLIERGQKYVENSLFVDGQGLDVSSGKKSPFLSGYKSTFGDDPSLFEAQAYDVGILLRQIIASGERSRVGLSEKLQGTTTFSGALGTMYMNPRRELVRPMTLFTVKAGNITPLAEKALRR